MAWGGIHFQTQGTISMIRHPMIVVSVVATLFTGLEGAAQVTLHPSDNVSKIVNSKPAGTTFIFTPGTYRLSQAIVPKDNDKFIGETFCAPPANPCPAIISGSVLIGPLATPEGGNYAVAKQTQQGGRGGPRICDAGWEGCKYPEDLFFDGVPYKHLDSPTMPSIGPGEWWFDYANHIIYFHDDPTGHKVETSTVNNGFGGPANSVTIQYLTMEEFADMYPIGAIGMSHGDKTLTEGTNWTISHCEVRLNHGFGVRIGFGMHILDNYIHDNGENGIGGGLGSKAAPETESSNSGILIQGNIIEHNNFAHFHPGFGSGGIKLGAASGVVVRGNRIEHNEGAGIHFDVDGLNEFVDGNIINDNSDNDALVQELGGGHSTFRNNIVTRNGAHLNGPGFAYEIAVRASSGVDIYCNVIEVPAAEGVGAWHIGSASRGNSEYPPFNYHATTGNSFHHNTVIWDAGANGEAGMRHNDPNNQPNFFSSNAPPDYNNYHMQNPSAPRFVYDNDNSRTNRQKPFSNHQRSRADVHSTVDANYNSGFPQIAITSPADQSNVNNPVTVSASASDPSGIRKVEFYVDWKLENTVTTAPYDFDWSNGTSGSHIVTAMAYSNAGVRTCYAVTLNEQ